MKKFLIASLLLGTTVILHASQRWTITTSCGAIEQITVADGTSLSDLKTAIQQTNKRLCGTVPRTITLTY